jgi:hypothetical protein
VLYEEAQVSMNSEQKRILDLIRTSKLLYPSWGQYDRELIEKHWIELQAIAEGRDDARALPPEFFDGVDIDFALMSDAERIALYQRDPVDQLRKRSFVHDLEPGSKGLKPSNLHCKNLLRTAL